MAKYLTPQGSFEVAQIQLHMPSVVAELVEGTFIRRDVREQPVVLVADVVVDSSQRTRCAALGGIRPRRLKIVVAGLIEPLVLLPLKMPSEL